MKKETGFAAGIVVATLLSMTAALAQQDGPALVAAGGGGGGGSFSGGTITSSLIIDGVTTDITTGTNESLALVPNGSGEVLLGGTTDSGAYAVQSNGHHYVNGGFTVASGYGATFGGAITAQQAFIDAVASITYGASTAIDFAATTADVRTITITGNITFTTTNLAAGRSKTIVITCDTVDRTVTWPSWKVPVGASLPTTCTANKQIFASATAISTTDSSVYASGWVTQ